MIVRTHKLSGWTRTALGHSEWRITPTDGSGDRVVHFLGAGCWQNLPNDSREDIDKDRVVMISGPALPKWATDWLDAANRKSCQSGRNALRAAIDDANWHADSRDGW